MERLGGQVTDVAPLTRLAVIQPTPFCNLDCRYCYLPNRTSTARLADGTILRIGRLLFSSKRMPSELTIAWHAGEPLVLPPSFYARAFQLLDSQRGGSTARIVHAFQTNGTLIDPDWCDFLLEHGAKVGVSLDGPAWLHDSDRVDRRGRGTFDRAIRGVRLLREHGIPFHVIMVLTERSLHHADEVWAFLLEHQIKRVAFSVEEIEGTHRASSLSREGTAERLKAFFERLLELRAEAPGPQVVREIDVLRQRIEHARGRVRSSENTPLAIVSFDCHGNVSTFSPELLSDPQFHFGHVRHLGCLDDILSHPSLLRARAEIDRGRRACEVSCEYYALCGGGPPSNKFAEHGTFASTETLFCRLRVKALTDLLLDRLEREHGLAPDPVAAA